MEYYNRVFDSTCLRNSEVVWKKLNNVINPNKVNDPINSLVIDNEEIGGKELADRFNNFFIEIGKGVHSPEAAADISSLTESLFFCPTHPDEIITLFQKFKNSHCCDADDLEIRPIKHVLDLIAPTLTHVFNAALLTGVFPNKMKTAKVVIIHKGGDKNMFSNYRPVSILPVFSKCLEKIINVRIDSFLGKHKLINDFKFGFRKGLSTESALLAQKEIILENFENKLLTLGVYLDFSKAFDRVDHLTLVAKLENYVFVD